MNKSINKQLLCILTFAFAIYYSIAISVFIVVEASEQANQNTCGSAPGVVRCIFTTSDTIEAVYLGNELMNDEIVDFAESKDNWRYTKVLDFCEPVVNTKISFLISQHGIALDSIAPRCQLGNLCDEPNTVGGSVSSRERPGFQLRCMSSDITSEWNLITDHINWNTFKYESNWPSDFNEFSFNAESPPGNSILTRHGPIDIVNDIRDSGWLQSWWRDFYLTLRNFANLQDNFYNMPPGRLRTMVNTQGPYQKPFTKIWGDIADETLPSNLVFQREVVKEQTTVLKRITPDHCGDVQVPYYFSGRCYFVSGYSRSWSAALSDCQSRGATLTSIHSTDENWFIFHERNCKNCWIGLHQVANGQFGWPDGSEYHQTNEHLPEKKSVTSTSPK
jgi:hypothetical protein